VQKLNTAAAARKATLEEGKEREERERVEELEEIRESRRRDLDCNAKAARAKEMQEAKVVKEVEEEPDDEEVIVDVEDDDEAAWSEEESSLLLGSSLAPGSPRSRQEEVVRARNPIYRPRHTQSLADLF
jgi:hypothetical protein